MRFRRRRRPRRLPFTRPELAALWIRAGGNPARAQLAAAVALGESGGYADALAAHDGRVGLWLPPAWAYDGHPLRELRDPLANATAAITLSRNGEDWSAFPAYAMGIYRQFLRD
ncbi:MAG TPA: hypothetical protein VE733_22220 [Streptosporangiaceae bacterium]|nr:hypothetical protein [Streptosporangiaceae bacterium]